MRVLAVWPKTGATVHIGGNNGARAREGERGGQAERIVGTLDTILVAPPHVHLRRDLEESRCGGQTLGPSAPWSAETFPRRSRKQWRPVKLHS